MERSIELFRWVLAELAKRKTGQEGDPGTDGFMQSLFALGAAGFIGLVLVILREGPGPLSPFVPHKSCPGLEDSSNRMRGTTLHDSAVNQRKQVSFDENNQAGAESSRSNYRIAAFRALADRTLFRTRWPRKPLPDSSKNSPNSLLRPFKSCPHRFHAIPAKNDRDSAGLDQFSNSKSQIDDRSGSGRNAFRGGRNEAVRVIGTSCFGYRTVVSNFANSTEKLIGRWPTLHKVTSNEQKTEEETAVTAPATMSEDNNSRVSVGLSAYVVSDHQIGAGTSPGNSPRMSGEPSSAGSPNAEAEISLGASPFVEREVEIQEIVAERSALRDLCPRLKPELVDICTGPDSRLPLSPVSNRSQSKTSNIPSRSERSSKTFKRRLEDEMDKREICAGPDTPLPSVPMSIRSGPRTSSCKALSPGSERSPRRSSRSSDLHPVSPGTLKNNSYQSSGRASDEESMMSEDEKEMTTRRTSEDVKEVVTMNSSSERDSSICKRSKRTSKNRSSKNRSSKSVRSIKLTQKIMTTKCPKNKREAPKSLSKNDAEVQYSIKPSPKISRSSLVRDCGVQYSRTGSPKMRNDVKCAPVVQQTNSRIGINCSITPKRGNKPKISTENNTIQKVRISTAVEASETPKVMSAKMSSPMPIESPVKKEMLSRKTSPVPTQPPTPIDQESEEVQVNEDDFETDTSLESEKVSIQPSSPEDVVAFETKKFSDAGQQVWMPRKPRKSKKRKCVPQRICVPTIKPSSASDLCHKQGIFDWIMTNVPSILQLDCPLPEGKQINGRMSSGPKRNDSNDEPISPNPNQNVRGSLRSRKRGSAGVADITVKKNRSPELFKSITHPLSELHNSLQVLVNAMVSSATGNRKKTSSTSCCPNDTHNTELRSSLKKPCESLKTTEPDLHGNKHVQFVCMAKTTSGWQCLEKLLAEKTPSSLDATKFMLGFDLKAGSWAGSSWPDSMQVSRTSVFQQQQQQQQGAIVDSSVSSDAFNDEPLTRGYSWDSIPPAGVSLSAGDLLSIKRRCDIITGQLSQILTRDGRQNSPRRLESNQQHVSELQKTANKLQELCMKLAEKDISASDASRCDASEPQSCFCCSSRNGVSGEHQMLKGGIRSGSKILVKFSSDTRQCRSQCHGLGNVIDGCVEKESRVSYKACSWERCHSDKPEEFHMTGEVLEPSARQSKTLSPDPEKTSPTENKISTLFTMYEECKKYLETLEHRVSRELSSRKEGSSSSWQMNRRHQSSSSPSIDGVHVTHSFTVLSGSVSSRESLCERESREDVLRMNGFESPDTSEIFVRHSIESLRPGKTFAKPEWKAHQQETELDKYKDSISSESSKPGINSVSPSTILCSGEDDRKKLPGKPVRNLIKSGVNEDIHHVSVDDTAAKLESYPCAHPENSEEATTVSLTLKDDPKSEVLPNPSIRNPQRVIDAERVMPRTTTSPDMDSDLDEWDDIQSLLLTDSRNNRRRPHPSGIINKNTTSSNSNAPTAACKVDVSRSAGLEQDLPVLLAQPGIQIVSKKDSVPGTPYFLPTASAPSIGPLLQSLLHNPACAFYFDSECADHVPKGSLCSYLSGFNRFVWGHEKRLAFYPEKLLNALDARSASSTWSPTELMWNLMQGCATDIADFESKRLQIGLDPSVPRFRTQFFGQVTIRASCPDCDFRVETKSDVLQRSHPDFYSDPAVWAEKVRSDLQSTLSSPPPGATKNLCDHRRLHIAAGECEPPACLCVDIPPGCTATSVPMVLEFPAAGSGPNQQPETYDLISVMYGKKINASQPTTNLLARTDTQSGCAFRHLKQPSRWFYVKDDQVFEILHNSAAELSRKLASRGIIALHYVAKSWPEREAKIRHRLRNVEESRGLVMKK